MEEANTTPGPNPEPGHDGPVPNGHLAQAPQHRLGDPSGPGGADDLPADQDCGPGGPGGGREAGAGRSTGRRRRRPDGRVRWGRVLRWSAAAAAVLLAAGGVAGYLGYARLSGNISHQKVKDRLGGVRPPKYNKALNILLIGSDTRAGANASFGHRIEGARSDTIIVLHISPHRDGATAISLPRDSVVQAPSCTTSTGAQIPAVREMINATFTAGGAACTWKTIEATTGIHIDHFIQIDFSGFKRMVDALGGVQICLPQAIDDPKSQLKLAAGRHQVKGDTALAYVRTRYSIGDGSDLGRIKRQQLFMASVVHKATSSDLVTDPTRLYGFLDAATKSITTDNDLGIGTLRKIADSVRGMTSGKVRFVTVPNHYWEVDPNRVVWTQPDAQHLFDTVKNDTATPPPPPPP
ncbi:MAG: hypothetical protein QOE54_3567, partial [Streptosporangiaceae bacterium]|nr:hypothetical protein [Streptosporangiaceae bacterium]